MNIGSYVYYKWDVYIILAVRGKNDHLRLIGNADGKRLQVGVDKLELIEHMMPATIVNYKGGSFLVTKKNNIFSLRTHRLMKWPADDTQRLAIVAIAREVESLI